MTATLRLKVNAGAPVEAKPGPDVAPGDALQLVLSSTTGVDKVRWRIVSFPDGFDPSGSWLLVDSAWECYGIDGSSQISLPGSGFDTYLFEAIINDGLTNGVADPSLTLRGGAVVRSERGLRQIAYLETDHIDTDREWVSAIRELIAAADSGPTQGRQSHADAVLWYKFDDISGALVNSGTATSASLTVDPKIQYGIPGPLGRSVYVDTASGGGATGASGASPGTTAATIWIWLTPLLPTGPQWLWGKLRTSDSGIRMGILADGGLVSGTINTGSPVTITAAASLSLAGGVPNLVALTYGADLLRLYINGTLAAEDAASGSVVWTNESNLPVWAIGKSATGDASPQVIHETGADSRAYSGAEIAEMYRRGMGWR